MNSNKNNEMGLIGFIYINTFVFVYDRISLTFTRFMASFSLEATLDVPIHRHLL